MKPIFTLGALAAAALLAGCSTSPYGRPLVLDSVGPAPRAATLSPDGSLLVYSEMNTFDDEDNDPLDTYYQYSDYEIWGPRGRRLVERVHNHDLPFSSDEPTRVELKPGRYLVKAVSNRYGWVCVPVVIEAHRTTTVHLEGDDPHLDKTKSSPDKVYLPDGEVVGARSRG